MTISENSTPGRVTSRTGDTEVIACFIWCNWNEAAGCRRRKRVRGDSASTMTGHFLKGDAESLQIRQKSDMMGGYFNRISLGAVFRIH